MFTRTDRLTGRCTHAEYYRQIIKETGYQVKLNSGLIKAVKLALNSGNLWLIDVPKDSVPFDLDVWDGLTVKVDNKKLHRSLKERGDSTSQLTTLYLNKEYARMKHGNGQVVSFYKKILSRYKKGSPDNKSTLGKELRRSWNLTLREERTPV